MTAKGQCLCREILYHEFGRWHDCLVIHLSGCPEDYQVKEYDALPWYKKLFHSNPRSIYKIHTNVLIKP